MRVFVLGAGASVHAGYPISSNLGCALLEWADDDKINGPYFSDDLRSLHKEFGGLRDFEKVISKLYEDLARGARKRIPQLGDAISFFFNSIRHQPAELYDRLAMERIRPGDVVITFNYDLAVERSLRTAGLWEVSDGYGRPFNLNLPTVPGTKVRVLKAHGSTNWWGSVFGGSQGFSAVSNSIGYRPVLYFEPDFEFLGYHGIRDPKSPSQSGLISSLILPAREKRFFAKTLFGNEWEPFWDSIWAEAHDALRRASAIVLIGYSMPSADKRACDLLLRASNRGAEITICCGGRTDHIVNEFTSNGFALVVAPNQPTFAAWLDT